MKQQGSLLPDIDDDAQTREGRKPDFSDDPSLDRLNQRDVSTTEQSDGVPTHPESAMSFGGKRARIMPDQVQQMESLLDAKIQALPVVSPGKSTEAAVKVLAPKIRALLRRGCPLEDIASDLRANGLPIATGTLRGYLPKKRKKAANVAKPMKNQTGLSVQQFDVGDL